MTRWALALSAGLLVGQLAAGERAAAQCAGDCDGNGAVSIAELITGVNMALGVAAEHLDGARAPPPSFDKLCEARSLEPDDCDFCSGQQPIGEYQR